MFVIIFAWYLVTTGSMTPPAAWVMTGAVVGDAAVAAASHK